jgi:DNA-binding SARP family transcriptional activator
MDIEFGLLGPLDVRVGGQQLLVRSPKLRILLASLLLEPGRLVPVTMMVEAIWGAHKPQNPRRALQLYVTRLRTILLEAGAGPVITTGTDGYRAEVTAERVDVKRFHGLLARAHQAADRSDHAGEWAALAEATSLWRGDALADVPSDFLHREYGHHLGERRLRALERRIDLSLRDGRHVEAVDELVKLTAAHPLREKLWVQLITALDRSGRRADALTSYHLMRRQLAEELGVEPGVELRELHARVLAGGAVAGTTGPAPFPAVPRQLPAEVIGFAGRADEISRLHAVLDEHEAETDRSTILVMTGMAGVGKTALAGYWSRRIADRFPDGQLWVDLRGYHHRAAVTAEQALASILRAFDIQGRDIPAELDSLVGLYRSVTDGRRMLVVLDNVSSVDQVYPLLPGGVGSFVLVTSRNELTGLVVEKGAQAIRLDPFTTGQARQMLARRLGGHRVDAERDAVDRIIGRCGGLPLALAIVAARAVARPGFALDALDQQLADASDQLDNFASPDGGVDVRAIFSWSYQTLTAPAARLFRFLGLHPTTELSSAAAASLVGAARSEARRLLDELAGAHLVTERVPDRFALHDLLHPYATELATGHETSQQRRAGQRRLLEFLTCTALNARPLLQPSESDVAVRVNVDSLVPLTFGSERHAREWYQAERHNLIAGVDLAYALRFDDLCWRVAYASWIYLHLNSSWNDVLRTHEMGLRAAERSGDRAGEAHMLSGIGSAYRATGRRDLAVQTQRRALGIFREVADVPGTATALSNLGAAYRDAGMFDEALACSRQAYEVDRARNEPGNMAISLYQIGLTLTAAGRAADAIPVICESLGSLHQIGHRRGEALVLYALATAHTHLGQHDAAADHYRTALDINLENGDRRHQAATLDGLGDALHKTGRFRESHDAWKHALAIYEELGAPDAAGLLAKLERHNPMGPQGSARRAAPSRSQPGPPRAHVKPI